MPVRVPLYVTPDGHLENMSSTAIDLIKNEMVNQYSSLPSVILEVVDSIGSETVLSDTRLQAGVYATSIGSDSGIDTLEINSPVEASTAEPTIVTVLYDRINQTEAADALDDSKFFLYVDSIGISNIDIKKMTYTDMFDTFIDDALNTIVDNFSAGSVGGTYTINTSSSIANHTLISSTPVFINTEADPTLYTAAGIPETLDQPQTLTNYYLHQIDGDSSASVPSIKGCHYDGSDIKKKSEAELSTMCQNLIRYAAADTNGIDYAVSTSSSGARGSAMVDTRLNGAGNHQIAFFGVDDYRAQEFPDGSSTTISTNYLRCYRA